MAARKVGEYGGETAAARRDGDLRDLLRLHPGEAEVAPSEGDERRPTLIPAHSAAYRGLESIRYVYPVVLLGNGADAVVAALAGILDGLLREIAPPGADGDGLRRDAYRLEARIKRLAETDPGRDLSTLWKRAAAQLLDETVDAGRRDILRRHLETARSALPHDGPVLPCGPETARRVLEHGWGRLRAELARRDGEILDDLVRRLSDVLEAERAQSPESASAEALRASMGDGHAGRIDFAALSSLLRAAGRYRKPNENRTRRLRDALAVIGAERARLSGPEAETRPSGSPARRPAPAESCLEAIEAWRSEIRRQVELVRAVRIATLELENRYREERHDAFFAGFEAGQLTPEEHRAFPPLLVCLDSDRLDDAEKSALVEILASEMPLKVFLAVREIPGTAGAGGGPEALTEWPARIGTMAMSIGEAFVVQTAASHLPQLAPEIVAALRHEGPALFAVYTGPVRPDGALPAYVLCAAAVESRLFPSFVCDPGRGTDWASRLSLEGSPQADRVWPLHRLSYEDPDGQRVEEDAAFTCADFLALDVRFLPNLAVVPRSRWHPRMVPLAEYLALPAPEAADRVPYLRLADASDRLHRAVVTQVLVEHARRCAANWQRLQELAGAHAASAIRLLEEERARLEEERQRAVAAGGAAVEGAVEGAVAAAEAVEAAVPGPGETVGPSRDKPSIETALCTTCDECIARNPRMFAYNEAKQAVIRDVRAGTYRELVEAAENCPVCIIHPGKPLDSTEPGLEELLERAAPFR